MLLDVVNEAKVPKEESMGTAELLLTFSVTLLYAGGLKKNVLFV
jgi:hypothetical protein